MRDSELPVHFRFAFGQAFLSLGELVRSFDFLRLTNGHTYVGIEPDYLVKVIDGFLGEPAGVLYQGEIANLNKLRKSLVEQIQPAYREGLEAGRRNWHDGDGVYGSLSTESLHQRALQLAPESEMLRGWFAEAFCFAFSIEQMESLRAGN
jgi:hypothetical protein